jgi:hypothetical protein
MTLSEPTTLASDWVLAAIALVLGLRLWRGGGGDRRRPRRLWSAAFLVGAGAAFAGGIVHGFAASLGPSVHAFLWAAVLVGTGVSASLILGATVLATVAGPWRTALLSGVAGQLGAFLVVVGASASTRHAVWNGALAIALTFLLALSAAGRDRAFFLRLGLGLALAAAGLYAQRSGLAFSVLNHNDVCHGLQALSLWPLYRAGLGLRDAAAGAATPRHRPRSEGE